MLDLKRSDIASGISKEQLTKEINQLNRQIKIIEQKLILKVDREILAQFQHLENTVTFTSRPMKHIKNRLWKEERLKKPSQINSVSS